MRGWYGKGRACGGARGPFCVFMFVQGEASLGGSVSFGDSRGVRGENLGFPSVPCAPGGAMAKGVCAREFPLLSRRR